MFFQYGLNKKLIMRLISLVVFLFLCQNIFAQSGCSDCVNCSSISEWSSSVAYTTSGLKVKYNGVAYTSNWYTINQQPGQSQAWSINGVCNGSQVDGSCGGIAPWNVNVLYNPNSTLGTHKVVRNCKIYVAQWYSFNQDPLTNSGIYQVWKLLGDCPSNNNNTSITFTPSAQLCLSALPLTLSAIPSGGVFSGTGVSGNQFNPTSSGLYSVNYTYTPPPNGCVNSSSQTVSRSILVKAPNTTPITISTPSDVCTANLPLTLVASPSGGTFTGNNVNSNGQLLNQGQTTSLIQYTLPASISCGGIATGTKSIKLNSPFTGVPAINFPDIICKDALPIVLSAIPQGGVFYLNNNVITQIPSVVSGDYAINYNLPLSATVCGAQAQISKQLTVRDRQSFSIQIAGATTICLGSSAIVNLSSNLVLNSNQANLTWYKNNLLIPNQTGMSLTISDLVSGDKIKAKSSLISTPECTTNNLAESNELSFTVLPLIVPTISISALPKLPVVDGTNVTFSSTLTPSKSYFSTQWLKSAAITTTSTSNFTTPINVGDFVQAKLTVPSNNDCITPGTYSSEILSNRSMPSYYWLKEQLDGTYQNTANNELLLYYNEEYLTGNLKFEIIDESNIVIATENQITVQKNIGANYSKISLGTISNLVINKTYTLQVLTEKNRKLMLRFKYLG